MDSPGDLYLQCAKPFSKAVGKHQKQRGRLNFLAGHSLAVFGQTHRWECPRPPRKC